MKLRGKIALAVVALVFFIMSMIAATTITVSFQQVLEVAKNNMETTADMTGEAIGSKMEGYQNATIMAGQEALLLVGELPDKKRVLNAFVETYGFTSGNVLSPTGVSYLDGTDFSDRDYVKKALAGIPNVSDVTLSKLTGTYGVSVAAPLQYEGNVIGVVYFRLDSNFLQEIIESMEIGATGYAFIIDGSGNVIAHPDPEMIMNPEAAQGMEDQLMNIMTNECGNFSFENDDKKVICGFSTIPNTNGWKIIVVEPQHDYQTSTQAIVEKVLLLDVVGVIIGIIFAIILGNIISKQAGRVQQALTAVAEGDFSAEIPHVKKKDELGKLQNATADLQQTLSGIIGEANGVLDAMAHYDLTSSDLQEYPGEFATLAESVNHIKTILGSLVREIQESADCVNEGAGQLASATSVLSQGALSQASSIAQLEMSMQDISDKIHHTSENGRVVNGQLGELDTEINDSNAQMKELRLVVDEITAMTTDISKIVSTIDSIAFQTNILALNASVEAARAGESGKGFAVVAEEVRSLAAKSAESSAATAELIERCIRGIDNAKECVDKTFGSLTTIVENSSTISTAFADITADTEEEAVKASEVLEEIGKISDVVQSNTAMAEETAASTEELSGQARNLQDSIGRFRV